MMGMRVRIENTGNEEFPTSAVGEFYDADNSVDAHRLGQLIGYAIQSMNNFLVPRGDVIEGIKEVIGRSYVTGEDA